MTPENFTYWLQGWFELNDTIDHRDGATAETLKVIRKHLNLVFNKVTPELKIDIDGKKVLNDLGIDFQLEQKKITDEYLQRKCQSVSSTIKDGLTQTFCGGPFGPENYLSSDTLPKVHYQQPANSC